MGAKYLKIKDSDGIYYVADGQISPIDGYAKQPRQFKQDFKLWFKVTKMTNGKRIYKKKTLKYSQDTTLKSAVHDAEEHKKALHLSLNTNKTFFTL